MTPSPRLRRRNILAALLLGVYSVAGGVAGETQRAAQDGLSMEFSVAPLDDGVLTSGRDATLTVTLRHDVDGTPLRGATVGGWLGARDRASPPAAGTPRCTAEAAAFSRGSPLAAPALDVNGYYLVSMNRDASLSVIDPSQGFGGSRLVAAPVLTGPGSDWALTPDRRHLIVTETTAGRVAIIDGAVWRVLGEVPLPGAARVVLAPDSLQPWIGYTATAGNDGVALLDLATRAIDARLSTGVGPHDLAFAEGGRFLLVTNHGGATVSVIDVAARRVTGTVAIDGHPVSIAYGPLAWLTYVASDNGTITAIDAASRTVVATIRTDPGIAALRFTADGRHALVTSRDTGRVLVIDSASNEVVQTVAVGGEPDQIVFSDQLAYIRRRRSDTVAALPLSQIGKPGQPIAPANVSAGQFAMGAGSGSVLADAIAQVPGHAAVVAANPADGAIYYYHEGMIAPQASFDNIGAKPAAVLAADRSLREVAAGRYETVGRLPRAGTYDAVFYVDSPRLVQCFSLQVERRPDEPAIPKVAFTALPNATHVGRAVVVNFQLIDPDSGTPIPDARDVTLLTFRQPGDQQSRSFASPTADGGYAATFKPLEAGSYYVFVESRSLALRPATAGLVTVTTETVQ